jgi:hypothetical protein
LRFGNVESPSRAFDAYVPAETQRATELREEGFSSDLCL